MLIQIDSKKLQAFLKDAAEVFSMIGGDEEIGKESAVQRLNTDGAKLSRVVNRQVEKETKLREQVKELREIYNKLDDQATVDQEIFEIVSGENEDIEKSQGECVRFLIGRIGYKGAKNVIDVESD